MDNMRIFHAFEYTPKEAKKQITGGRLNGMTDVNPMYRIRMLTDRFGPCGIGWYTEITRRETVAGSKGELMCFVDLNLYYRENGEDEWSKPVFGTGGNALISVERNGLYANDEGWKMAYTDALSIACKNLGMCADVYFEKGYGKYTAPGADNADKPAQKQPQKAQSQKATTAPSAPASASDSTQHSGKDLATMQQIEFIFNYADDELINNARRSFGENLERMTYAQGQKMIERINDTIRRREQNESV